MKVLLSPSAGQYNVYMRRVKRNFKQNFSNQLVQLHCLNRTLRFAVLIPRESYSICANWEDSD